jgi:hypothetical protein
MDGWIDRSQSGFILVFIWGETHKSFLKDLSLEQSLKRMNGNSQERE